MASASLLCPRVRWSAAHHQSAHLGTSNGGTAYACWLYVPTLDGSLESRGVGDGGGGGGVAADGGGRTGGGVVCVVVWFPRKPTLNGSLGSCGVDGGGGGHGGGDDDGTGGGNGGRCLLLRRAPCRYVHAQGDQAAAVGGPVFGAVSAPTADHACPRPTRPEGLAWLHIPKTGTTFGNAVLHLMFVFHACRTAMTAYEMVIVCLLYTSPSPRDRG